MFAWFQRLLPERGDFFGMFEAHAAMLVAAADALNQLASDHGSTERCLKTIQDREHVADDVIRDVLTTVRRTFLTPFDRGAITSLIGAMDDSIDEMLAAARAIDLYEVQNLQQEMKDIVAIIVEAARVTNEAIPLLRNVSKNSAELHRLTERLVRLEGRADDIHAAGLRTAFREVARKDALRFAVTREILRHLERVTDAFEDVANQIDGIVIDHA
jgi:predicted phosphate transport protein (TIGR00153 family)